MECIKISEAIKSETCVGECTRHFLLVNFGCFFGAIFQPLLYSSLLMKPRTNQTIIGGWNAEGQFTCPFGNLSIQTGLSWSWTIAAGGPMAPKNDVVFVESESAFRKRDGSTRPLGRPLGIVGNPPSKIIPIVTSKVGIFCQKLIHLDPKKPQRISIPQSKMISKFVPMFFVLLLITVIISIFGQINGQRAHFIAQRGMAEANAAAPNHPIRSLEGAVADRVENQLLGALELLQTYQEAEPFPAKFAEKKRNNKFEFIRFGRRRR